MEEEEEQTRKGGGEKKERGGMKGRRDPSHMISKITGMKQICYKASQVVLNLKFPKGQSRVLSL